MTFFSTYSPILLNNSNITFENTNHERSSLFKEERSSQKHEKNPVILMYWLSYIHPRTDLRQGA